MFVEHKYKKKEKNKEVIVVKYLIKYCSKISEKRLMLLFFALYLCIR